MKKQVLCGVDRLDEYAHLLKGKRLGLITNPTGVNRSLVATVDILNENYNLVCLMSPEHGVRGDLQAGDKVSSYTDKRTGLPVHSLYGESCHLTDEVLNSIDTVVFDIQDAGARFYTYLYTLAYAMEDCAKAGRTVIVLDRPNPISCKNANGTVLDMEFRSFVGRFSIATAYGMTIGEYAKFINTEYNINCNLQIVELKNYTRELYYDDTDLIWVSPSPNLPSVDSCLCYIGTCIFEGTNMSEGRGTTKPFEIVGAPWLNAREIIGRVKAKGCQLRETYFKPTFSKFKDELCCGIQIHITDRSEFDGFELGIRLLDAIRKTHSELEFITSIGKRPFIDLLLGCDDIRGENFSVEEFLTEQAEKVALYKTKSEQYRLY